MFKLTEAEFKNLIFQSGTSRWGGTRKLPSVFTEQGVAILSGVLNSKRAVQANIQIMRAFVQMRTIFSGYRELKKKVNAMESKYNAQFKIIFDAIKQLLTPTNKPNKKIGY